MVILTVVIRLILSPLLWKGQNAQKKLASLQPEIKRIQEETKGNKEAQGKALMQLYANHNISPFSGCLVILIQLPILIALFRVFQKGLNAAELSNLYSFVPNPGSINSISFGVLNLALGNLYLGAVAAITQYFQIKLTMPAAPADKKDFAAVLQWQSLYIFPALILVWSYTLPSALTLYWTALNLFGIVQEIVTRRIKAK